MTLSFVLSTIHFFYTTLSLPIIELVPYTTWYSIVFVHRNINIITILLVLCIHTVLSLFIQNNMLYYSMLCFAMLCSTILMIYLLCYTSYAIICHVILLFFNRTSWSPAIWTQTVPTSAEQRCPPSLSARTATIAGWSTTLRIPRSAPRTVLTTGALWRVKFWIR